MLTNRLLKSIRLRNFLSYGPDGDSIELLPLNVIIGPNCSGKSNLLEAIDILRATPSDVTQPIRDGGGVEDYLWKGAKAKRRPTAEIEAVFYYPEGYGRLNYRFAFSTVGQRFEILATRDTTKGEYHKIRHAHKLLEIVNVGTVRGAAPHCQRLFA